MAVDENDDEGGAEEHEGPHHTELKEEQKEERVTGEREGRTEEREVRKSY